MTNKAYYHILGLREKPFLPVNHSFLFWFLLFTCTLLSLFLIYFNSPILLDNSSNLIDSITKKGAPILPTNDSITHDPEKLDECEGKYIFVQDLPTKFNYDLLKNCSTLNKWLNMCDYLVNSGLGPSLNDSNQTIFSDSGWFATNQFSLEIIFHGRIKQYKCLTNDSSRASAVFVPFYAGLDAGRYLWNPEVNIRDSASIELVNYLKHQPEWSKMGGRDHFLVAGRVSWDFRRQSDQGSDWGNCLLALPEVKNTTNLVIESSPWNNSDFAIPYPTNFHPSSDAEIYNWQARMRRQKRPYLFSFAGAPRPQVQDSIRNEIIKQCLASKGKNCKFLKCDPNIKNCDRPGGLMGLFQRSVFCLQPPGDSFTRKSTFDSILAGCIPVFFHPASAYVQYLWHLPKDYTSYSVFIPMEDVKNGNLGIEKTLLEISEEKMLALREKVISLIPRLSYANPNSRLETFEDAFDVAIREVLKRIELIRMDMKGEKNSTFASFPEEYTWKYNLNGGLDNHEWDNYFLRT